MCIAFVQQPLLRSCKSRLENDFRASDYGRGLREPHECMMNIINILNKAIFRYGLNENKSDMSS